MTFARGRGACVAGLLFLVVGCSGGKGAAPSTGSASRGGAGAGAGVGGPASGGSGGRAAGGSAGGRAGRAATPGGGGDGGRSGPSGVVGSLADPAACAQNFQIIYQSAPAEASPGAKDLAWRPGTLFVGHSGSGYSWVFSLPERGGAKNLLYEGHVLGWWLEGDQLIYGQQHDLFMLPQTGAPPTAIDHFGDDLAIGFSGGVLDRDALYWGGYSVVSIVEKHVRGGADTLLAELTDDAYQGVDSSRFVGVGNLLLFEGRPSQAAAFVLAVDKTTGALSKWPGFGTSGKLLATAVDGTMLWGSTSGAAQSFDQPGLILPPVASYGRSTTDGTAAIPFATTLPSSATPLAAWPAGGGAWYVAVAELTAAADEVYLSYWYVASDGTAERQACDPMPHASALAGYNYPMPAGQPVAAVAGDGALYAAVKYASGNWLVARAATPGATAPPVDMGGAGGAGVPGAGGAGAWVNGVGGAVGATGHGCTEFPLANQHASLGGITSGPDGDVWFTELGAHAVAKINGSGCVTEYSMSSNSISSALTSTPDGHIWFAGVQDLITRMATDGTMVRPFTVSAVLVRTLVVGPDGNIWYPDGSKVSRLAPDGTVTSYTLHSNASAPSGIAVGSGGVVWYADSSYNNVGTIDPASGTVTTVAIPNGRKPGAMISGPDGNVWFQSSSSTAPTIALTRVTPGGVFTDFALPAGITVGGFTAGPDGNIWFTNYNDSMIGRLAPSTGVVDQFAITLGSSPQAIVTGADGNLWFTETSRSKIGRITPQ